MRHINKFPEFTLPEMDDLRKKIVNGVVMETFTATVPAWRQQALDEGKAWVQFPCWIGASRWEDGKGFKKFKFKKHSLYIHRASYECFNGPVPAGLLVDHLCRVRGCCQPMHLEAVTPKENIERGANQNHIMRDGAAPPIETAKQINPQFFEEPARHELSSEFFRRFDANRDVPREWDTMLQGPRPDAPDGFRWEATPYEGVCVLNPIRAYGPGEARPAAAWPDSFGQAVRDRHADAFGGPTATIPQVTVVDMGKFPITQPAPLLSNRIEPTGIEFKCIDEFKYIEKFPDDLEMLSRLLVYEESEKVANGYVPHGSSGAWLRQFLLVVGGYVAELSRYFWWRMSGRTSVW